MTTDRRTGRPARIMVFTGTRADFGLLQPVIQAIRDRAELEAVIVAGGSHFSPAYGHTVDEITKAGFDVDWRIDLDMTEDSDFHIATATGESLSSVAAAIDALSPDMGLVLGDRYEALAFSTACMLSRIPLAHVHGGEITEGAVDDAIRNAITQMATLHFVAASSFADRVIRMGVSPEDVIVCGAPGLDTVSAVMRTLGDPRPVVEAVTGPLPTGGPLFLVSYHPETRSSEDQGEVMETILEVLEAVDGATSIVSAPNADWGRNAVADAVERARVADPEHVRVVASFGHRAYIAAMVAADAVVGNSSSGIIEVPLTGTATVNIGARQSGRPMAESIFHSGTSRAEVAAAVSAALAWTGTAAGASSLYGDGDASSVIVDQLCRFFDR